MKNKTPAPVSHTIRLSHDGSIHRGLTVDGSEPGERDKKNCLIGEGGVNFRSPAGKPWFLRFSEFSFVINERKKPAAPALKKAA